MYKIYILYYFRFVTPLDVLHRRCIFYTAVYIIQTIFLYNRVEMMMSNCYKGVWRHIQTYLFFFSFLLIIILIIMMIISYFLAAKNYNIISSNLTYEMVRTFELIR